MKEYKISIYGIVCILISGFCFGVGYFVFRTTSGLSWLNTSALIYIFGLMFFMFANIKENKNKKLDKK